MQPMLNIALRAARSAGELIYRSMERIDVLTVDEKDARDYVTEIDRRATAQIPCGLSTHWMALPTSSTAYRILRSASLAGSKAALNTL